MTSYAYRTAPPTQISGCYVWLDASTSNNFTFSSGSNISTWIDRSGNGYTATAGNSPTYDAANRRVRFASASTQYMSNTASPLNLTQRSFFFVIEEITNTNVCGIMPIIPNPTSGLDYTTTTGMTIEGTTGFYFYANGGLYANKLNTTNPLAKAIYCETFGNPNGIVYLNGSSNNSARALYTPGTSSGYGLGARWDGGAGGIAAPYFNGYMYEVLTYSKPLSTSDRQFIEGYLAWKWNLQGNLPASHPYRNTAPGVGSPFPLFAPTQYSNCVLWLDAADRSTTYFDSAGTIASTGNGNRVAYWKDKSASANHASNTTSFPSLLTNYQNGRNALQFDYSVGVSCNYLLLDSAKLPNGSTNSTYFFVTRTASSAVQVFFSQGPATFTTGQAPQYYYNNYNYYADLYGSNAVTDTTTYNSVWAFACVTAGATMIGYDNGNSFAGTNNVTINPFNVGTGFAAVGITKVGSGLALPYTGQIGEIIAYSRVLTGTERQNVEGYLAWKWNTTTYLPSTHPYKTVIFNALPPFPNVTLGRYLLQQTTWLPTSINNLSLWLDAADKTTITGTNPVTGWTDKSSSPRTITFSGTSTYNSSTRSINTTNNPTNYFYANLNLKKSQVTYVSVFIVHTWTGSSLSSANQALWGQDIGGGWNRFQLLGFTANSSFAYGLSYTPSSPNVTVASALNTANRVIYSATYAYQITNGTFAYVNGTLATSLVTEAVSPGETTTTNTYFGTIDTGYSGQVAFHEIIIYTQEISAVQRQTVEGYLAWKWGLVASLPSNHPYKLFPPLPA